MARRRVSPEAAEIAPDPEASWDYQVRRALALYDQGSEFGDNAALAESIQVWREIVLPLAPRKSVPLDWAMAQNNLGDARNETLGAREAGTARLEEALVAYRAVTGGEVHAIGCRSTGRARSNNLGKVLGTLRFGARRQR